MRRLRLLALLLLVLTLAGSVTPATALDRTRPRKPSPGALWRAFPLLQRPVAQKSSARDATVVGSASQNDDNSQLMFLLMGCLVSVGITVAILVLRRTELVTAIGRGRPIDAERRPHRHRLRLRPERADPEDLHVVASAAHPGAETRGQESTRVAAADEGVPGRSRMKEGAWQSPNTSRCSSVSNNLPLSPTSRE
jgi:hypothetical protein